jgi:hypothetical protein
MSNKFSRTVTINRIMDLNEVAKRCDELGILSHTHGPHGGARKFIIDTFSETHAYRNDCESNEGADWDEEQAVGEDGRIALGQSHEDVFQDLAGAMGVELNNDEDYAKVEAVYKHFFEE